MTRALATGCTAGAIAVTLAVNEPANERLRGWGPADVPPDDWRAVRVRWDRGHACRRGLLAVAALAAAWGQIRDTRGDHDG